MNECSAEAVFALRPSVRRCCESIGRRPPPCVLPRAAARGAVLRRLRFRAGTGWLLLQRQTRPMKNGGAESAGQASFCRCPFRPLSEPAERVGLLAAVVHKPGASPAIEK